MHPEISLPALRLSNSLFTSLSTPSKAYRFKSDALLALQETLITYKQNL